jgi:hypothetical protein
VGFDGELVELELRPRRLRAERAFSSKAACLLVIQFVLTMVRMRTGRALVGG